MIKKFTRPFMPLVLLLSSKAFCNQMPSEDMPECLQVDLIEQSMPNPEDALRNCCKEKCKKCKCEKFCKLLVSKNLKTESLSVVKNATVGGNLAVTGSTTLNGYYPVLNQYEQVYNIKGAFAPQPNATVTITPLAPVGPEVYPLTLTITPSSTIFSGEGFTVSSISGFGTYYGSLNIGMATTVLTFLVTVTFDTPFTRVPIIVGSVNWDVALQPVFAATENDLLVDVQIPALTITNVSTNGFTAAIGITSNSLNNAPFSGEMVVQLIESVNSLLDIISINFIADGTITPTPVCPPCPTVKPSCCR